MLQSFLLTRRQTLVLGLNALAGVGAMTATKAACQYHKVQSQVEGLASADRNFIVESTATLSARAAAKGLLYGATARRINLEADQNLASQYSKECSVLVPEWELKWSAGSSLLRPTPDSFDFTDADWMANFAETRKLILRGHALIWHLCLPSWFEETVTYENAKQFLAQHIRTVVGRFAGRINSWDVVNEAIEPTDGQANGLRNTPWLNFIGEDYIDLAFRVAALADPKAMLVYNDYGLEYDIPSDEAKRSAVLKLLERLKSKGTPIHALGIQAHLAGHETRFKAQKFRKFLADVASLGLKILITEMDVSDENLPADLLMRDRIIAGAYEDFLSTTLDEQAVIAVITWGLSDRYTWLTEFNPRLDGLAVRPLPLDGNFQRKLSWNAIAIALDNAPARLPQAE